MSAAVRDAQVATEFAEAQITAACGALAADRWINGFGVYTDRSTVRSNLAAARDALDCAAKALAGQWPTNADYEEAE